MINPIFFIFTKIVQYLSRNYVLPCFQNAHGLPRDTLLCYLVQSVILISTTSSVCFLCRTIFRRFKHLDRSGMRLETCLYGNTSLSARMARSIRRFMEYVVWCYYELDFYFNVDTRDSARRPMYFSELVSQNSTHADIRKQLIPQYGKIVMKLAENSTHSHPKSAAYRSTVNNYLTSSAFNAGYEPYHVSKSARDEGDGTRYYYHPKDLLQEAKSSLVRNSHALIFTDVDYYADMPLWMNLFKPMLLYTFVPTRMSARTEEFSYHINGTEVEFNVAGGAHYKHQLWHYLGDTLTHVNPHTNELFVFSLESRMIEGDPHHRIVYILPSARIPAPYWNLLDLPRNDLKRWIFDGIIYDPINDIVSCLHPGTLHSIELPGRLYSSLSLKVQEMKSVEISAIERVLSTNRVPDPVIVAPILAHVLGRDLHRFDVLPTGSFPVNYYPTKGLTHDSGKPAGQAVTTPLVSEPALIPSRGFNSDLATIAGRIDGPRNNKRPPGRYNNLAGEFIKRLIPKDIMATGTAWSVEQVKAVQSSPSQRSRFLQVFFNLSDWATNKLRSFMKIESYSKISAPRNITTVSPEMTTLLSTLTYPFKEAVLKKCKFYAPGMNPNQICDRLAEITAAGTMSTDFSRFDGSISEWLQMEIVRCTYNRWLTVELRPTFLRWFDELFKNTATTSHGVQYRPGFGTRSGSPVTTDGNTMINAFVYFCAYRKLGYSVSQSFDSIGIVCGDDGVAEAREGLREALENVCFELGLSVEVEMKPPGPVNFCGRKFLDPCRSKDSHQDIKRTLMKLHLSSNTSVSREQAAVNRATGYLATDRLTPLLSDYCQRVLELCPIIAKSTTHEEDFKMNLAWPQTDEQAIIDSVCVELNLTRSELEARRSAIRAADSLDSFPVILSTQRDITLEAVVADEVCQPGLHLSTTPSISPVTETPKIEDVATTIPECRDSIDTDPPGGDVRVVRPLERADDANSVSENGTRPDRKPSPPKRKSETRAKRGRNNDRRRKDQRAHESPSS